jgi:trace amine associated receptor
MQHFATLLFHLCFISIDRYIAVIDPLVYPTKLTVSVSGICVGISWILPLVYSAALFSMGISDDGMENLVITLNCVGGCQIVVNQDWILVDFLLFFIPTLVMIILYSKIFLIAKQQAIKIETTTGSGKTESSSELHSQGS